ncbi:BarA sensory histidine kinase (= VarS = GacS), partial [hydrothermal vent metagenome]
MIKISISTKLALFISLIVSISVAMVAMFTYIRSENQLLESIGIELRSIVQSTAPLINAEMHDNFSFDSDDVLDQTSDFKQLQQQLIKVRDSNKMPHGSGLSPLYTLRKTWEFDENNQLEFVIMTDVNRQEKFYSGALYPVRNFQKKALQGDVVVTEIYRDDEGSWITAAAPIINEDNEIVAILQADRRVDFVYQQIWDLKLLYIEAGISSLILGVFLVMIFAWWSSKPIKELTHAVSQFGTGNLKYRINKIRGDEFGYLYKNFNKMAENIASTEKKLIKANFNSEQARMHAEADSNVKSEFLAVMSHEIRTPMNGILGMIQILKETELESSQRNYINTIYRSGNALLVILNDILDFSKFEEGNLDLDKTDFDLEHSCLDIMVLLKPKADKAGVKFYMHIAPECPKWVHGDAVRTRKILLNLISNSIKFTTNGYIYLDIDFRMIDDNKFDLLVSIYDSGIGISPENQSAIFNVFSQTDSSMSRKYSGTGLGLAISKNLLDLMEGELGVSSEIGVGSTFWFSLPLIRGENFSNKEMIEKVLDVDILFLETDVLYIESMIEKFKYLDI